MRLIAGDAFGLRNDVKTHSPLCCLHVVGQAGARFGLPRGYPKRDAYVAKGAVEVSGRVYTAGRLLVFTAGLDPVIVAREASTLLLLGGEPLGERFIWWNFVSSRRERIEQTKADWAAGGVCCRRTTTPSSCRSRRIRPGRRAAARRPRRRCRGRGG